MGVDVSSNVQAEQGITDDNILAIAKAWMERTLSSAAKGDPRQYRKMLTDLRDIRLEDDGSVTGLEFRLMVLSQSVYFINETYHQVLVDHLLGMSIWIYGGNVANYLLDFVVNLATANGGCVGQCIDMLVRNFLPPSCGLPAFLDTYSKAGLMGGWLPMVKIRAQQDSHIARKEDVLNRLHAAIKKIACLVPTIPLRLQNVIFKKMPHRSAAKEWNLLYLENMLRLESSGGHCLGNQMLPAIIDHLIQIDVEIRWEDIMNEEDTGKVYLFHMDVEDEMEDWEYNLGEAEGSSGPGMEGKSMHGLMERYSRNRVSTLDEMADKMDLMMDMTLDHLQNSAKSGHSLQVYSTLMKSFQSTILHTHKSKFTQFLIFYLCALEPTTCGSHFAALLCDIFISKTRPPNTRMSAAAYLASYLARGKFLSSDVIFTSLKRMVSWCIAYGVIKRPSIVPDGILHAVFFSVCQAVMYTLCFRFKLLAEDPEGRRVLRGLQLQKFVEHQLSPLKVCLPTIVEEFLKKASTLQLVDRKHWLSSKERLDRHIGGVTVGDVRLDMFFPFDPYLLRQSDRFIRPNFNFWYMVEPLAENDDASDCEDDYADAESDISSISEALPYRHGESLGSPVDVLQINEQFDHHDEENQGNFLRSDTQTINGTVGEAIGLDYSLVCNSPNSDGGFSGNFQNSFDSMALTPQALKMPAKLPAYVTKNIPISSGDM